VTLHGRARKKNLLTIAGSNLAKETEGIAKSTAAGFARRLAKTTTSGRPLGIYPIAKRRADGAGVLARGTAKGIEKKSSSEPVSGSLRTQKRFAATTESTCGTSGCGTNALP
jgi:hypothetical protein